MKKLLSILLVLAFVLCTAALAEGADLNKKQYVSARHGLKIHTEADLESEVTIVALFNLKVIVHEYTSDGLFAKVSYEYEGRTWEGWMWAEYLSNTRIKLSPAKKVIGTCNCCGQKIYEGSPYITDYDGLYHDTEKCAPKC